MLPLRDDVASRTFPLVTLAIVGLNVVAFLYQLSLELGDAATSRAAEQFVMEFGAVPCRLSGECAVSDAFVAPFATIFTSMFMHGGIVHIAGNMLYLWIFGDNVEDTLGHLRFVLFYLLSGVAAATAQTVMDPASAVPMVGASGAISGVLGAYLVLFPYARVTTLVTFGFFVRFVQIPAVFVLGFWIVVQFVSALTDQTRVLTGAGEAGGVAWFAHIGGFLAGVLLVFLLRGRAAGRL